MTLSRPWLAHNYGPGNPDLPPPLCFTQDAPMANRLNMPSRPVGGGTVGLTPQAVAVMMDPSDPSTWRRPYLFDVMPVIRDPDWNYGDQRTGPTKGRWRPPNDGRFRAFRGGYGKGS